MSVDPVLARRLTIAARKATEAGEWRRRRNQLVVEAVTAGGTQPEVAKLAGLTQSAVSQIMARHQDGSTS